MRTPKFNRWCDLDLRFKLNFKILRILWGDLLSSRLAGLDTTIGSQNSRGVVGSVPQVVVGMVIAQVLRVKQEHHSSQQKRHRASFLLSRLENIFARCLLYIMIELPPPNDKLLSNSANHAPATFGFQGMRPHMSPSLFPQRVSCAWAQFRTEEWPRRHWGCLLMQLMLQVRIVGEVGSSAEAGAMPKIAILQKLCCIEVTTQLPYEALVETINVSIFTIKQKQVFPFHKAG